MSRSSWFFLRLLLAGLCILVNGTLPQWSWDTLPIAYHGANHTGFFGPSEMEQLSKYALVTIEKWYTPCADSDEAHTGADIFDCRVEEKIIQTFQDLKAMNPKLFGILYLNTMFDFTAYGLHEKLVERDDQGLAGFLRDRHGTVVEMCNDNDSYCQIKTFDMTSPDVRQLWLDEVRNASAQGVDGIFADHSGAYPTTGDDPHANVATLCNGKGSKRSCWEFDVSFGEAFKEGHKQLLSELEDIVPYVSKVTRGGGFYIVKNAHGLGSSIVEVDDCDLAGDESKLAGYLCAVEEYTYLACYTHRDFLPTWYPAYDRPLGAPQGPAVESSPGSSHWFRKFESASGITQVHYDSRKKEGQIIWADSALF